MFVTWVKPCSHLLPQLWHPPLSTRETMWAVGDLEVPPAVAAVVLEAFQEAAAPTVPRTWEGEVAAALEDQGAAPPLSVAPAPDPLAFPNHPHASPNLSTTTTPRAPRGPTDQQVCGHPATHSPSPLTLTLTAPQMESCLLQRSLRWGGWMVPMEVTVITVTGHQRAVKKPRNTQQLLYHRWLWHLWISPLKALELGQFLLWFHPSLLEEQEVEERKHLSPPALLIKATHSGLWSLLCLPLWPAVPSPTPVTVVVQGNPLAEEAMVLLLIATPPTVRI